MNSPRGNNTCLYTMIVVNILSMNSPSRVRVDGEGGLIVKWKMENKWNGLNEKRGRARVGEGELK